MNTVTELLIEARDLISEPGRWTQGVYACDALGYAIDWGSPEAVCWCATGAICKAAESIQEHGKRRALIERATVELRIAIGHNGVTAFNDHRTHAEVLAAFDRAINDSHTHVEVLEMFDEAIEKSRSINS